MSDPAARRAHEDPVLFAEAVRFTAASAQFDPHLVEKDYFCTLVIEHLAAVDSLVFKGGTCLAKVHAGFYRLSEDLDYAIPVAADATRGERRAGIAPVKAALAGLPARVAALRLAAPLVGANNSTQYIAVLTYTSLLSGREERIKIEVTLREPLHREPVVGAAASVLLDPLTGKPIVPAVPVRCIAKIEAYAEKLRAALSRRDVAIRDFFDVDYAIRTGVLDVDDHRLLSLVRAKLAVPGNTPADVSPARLATLRAQLDAGLRPVLRPADFEAFDLDRAFRIVSEVAAALGKVR
jgi:predicted nucleotidyltransferase component of viral defense system